MKSRRIDRREFIQEVIRRIESNFPDSVVIWTGTGCPDEEYDDTEEFEALWIRIEDYERFEDFVWDLEENFAEPNGFSIMVHDLSPKVTKEYRWDEYQAELKKRSEIPVKPKRKSKKPAAPKTSKIAE